MIIIIFIHNERCVVNGQYIIINDDKIALSIEKRKNCIFHFIGSVENAIDLVKESIPLCIVLDYSLLFSHLVSWAISRNIPVALLEPKDKFYHQNGEIINIDISPFDVDTENVYDLKGRGIQFLATIRRKSDINIAHSLGMKNTGLVSMEFLLSDCYDITEKNVMNHLVPIFNKFPTGEIRIRLLDFDSSKKCAFIRNSTIIPRGIRSYSISYIEKYLSTILESILFVAQQRKPTIILPFVTDEREVYQFKNYLAQKNLDDKFKLGVMIETPSAAFSIPQFKDIVDYFSIGSNDLVNAFFCMDRNCSSKDIFLYSHSFLSFLKYIVSFDVDLSICGQLPLYPHMLSTLISLGYKNFSISPELFNVYKSKIMPISENIANGISGKIIAQR